VQDAAGVGDRRVRVERGDERRLGLPALARNQGGANVSSASSRTFEDMKVGVRCKIAALWIAMLFLFAYGDIFGFFSPGQIQEVMAGEVSGMAITQVFLFAVSLYVAVASVMVFLSLILSPTVNRWTNIVLPSLYVVSHRGLGDRRDVGVLLVLEQRRECPSAADRLVRLDLAQTGGNTLTAANPVRRCFAVRCRSGGPPMTCDSYSPTVTARGRRGPAVPDAARTQHGPGSRAWKARPGRRPRGMLRRWRRSTLVSTDRCCPWGPSGTDATGPRRARPAGAKVAWPRRERNQLWRWMSPSGATACP
jgi:hypothetical protein